MGMPASWPNTRTATSRRNPPAASTRRDGAAVDRGAAQTVTFAATRSAYGGYRAVGRCVGRAGRMTLIRGWGRRWTLTVGDRFRWAAQNLDVAA
jgi:hypothetical protein